MSNSDKTQKTDSIKQPSKVVTSGAAKPVSGGGGPAKTAPPPSSGSGSFVPVLAFVLAAVALGVGYVVWNQNSNLEKRLVAAESVASSAADTATTAANSVASTQSSLDAIKSAADSAGSSVASVKSDIGAAQGAIDSANATANASKSAVEALAATVQTLEDKVSQGIDTDLIKLRDKQSIIQDAIESLRASSSSNSDEAQNSWVVAEAEYLANIANQRLSLMGDVETAIHALVAADARLRTVSDAKLLDARGQIADEIRSLRAFNAPDIAGMALTLSALENDVSKLPIVENVQSSDESAPATEASAAAPELGELANAEGWRSLADSMWHEMKSLVVVRRSNETALPAVPVMPPGQRFFLYQNLRLKLEAARVSLLRSDQIMFRNSLNGARDWIKGYFANSVATSDMLGALDQLSAAELNPPLPDISSSLKILRDWNSQHQSTAALDSGVAQQ
ncbi:MAG: hypothetical protein GXP10_07690 [Gammaproteobacteria bacterium]|nr:hypothetical protein [Gammaproteobacteria bacterium]